ncbi:MAG: 23S rRNA (adenine(2503)-C(2))-methyltransferase RlmN [Fidelibacterota bacterium]|jgi:23S rRNA (adenine2503-C2)-methyltransferase|tara:strand:- start:2185 stop:3213 length:1029 start_codon:yes stop_codon:yes gene_type:complete
MTNKEKSFIGLDKIETLSLLKRIGAETFRYEQIQNWIFDNFCENWEEMKNIPKDLRDKLSEKMQLHPLQINHVSGSENEPTKKFLFKTISGHSLESVLMYEKNRTTVCISSQIGCAVDCKFCATASMGFIKNLNDYEIIDQVLHLERLSKHKITNIVFMGMGEPFLNYKNVIKAAKFLNHKMGFGARRITISTAGIVPKIRKIADEEHQFKLAISLNAVTEIERKKIMSVTNTYSLNELIDSARYYYQKTRRLITFEYVLLKGINDSPSDGKKLISLLMGLECKVNIIPYNEIGGDFNRPDEITIKNFLKELRKAPFNVTVRWSKGTDINAGCGQLAVEAIS